MRTASDYRSPAVPYHTPERDSLSTPNADPVFRNTGYITKQIGAAFAACFAGAGTLLADGTWDVNVADFPRQSGETGDSARIMRAVESAGEGGVVWFPRGEYAIDAMLYVTNFTSLLLHPFAHLKAVKPLPFLLTYHSHEEVRGIVKPGTLNLFIRGGDFDGAGLASCVHVKWRRHFTLSNATFRNGLKVGLQFGDEVQPSGCEMVVNNVYCYCDRPGMAGNVGFLTYIGDSHFTDVIVVDYTIGIRDLVWANRYTRCHVWGGLVKKPGTNESEYLPNSIAFDLSGRGSDVLLEDCYADTAMIGFNVRKNARIFNCAYFNNWYFKMDNPTVFRHEKGSLLVTGGRFAKSSPKSTLYSRGKDAEGLIWHDNKLLNFAPDELKGLNDELKKRGESDSAAKGKENLAS